MKSKVKFSYPLSLIHKSRAYQEIITTVAICINCCKSRAKAGTKRLAGEGPATKVWCMDFFVTDKDHNFKETEYKDEPLVMHWVCRYCQRGFITSAPICEVLSPSFQLQCSAANYILRLIAAIMDGSSFEDTFHSSIYW